MSTETCRETELVTFVNDYEKRWVYAVKESLRPFLSLSLPPPLSLARVLGEKFYFGKNQSQ